MMSMLVFRKSNIFLAFYIIINLHSLVCCTQWNRPFKKEHTKCRKAVCGENSIPTTQASRNAPKQSLSVTQQYSSLLTTSDDTVQTAATLFPQEVTSILLNRTTQAVSTTAHPMTDETSTSDNENVNPIKHAAHEENSIPTTETLRNATEKLFRVTQQNSLLPSTSENSVQTTTTLFPQEVTSILLNQRTEAVSTTPHPMTDEIQNDNENVDPIKHDGIVGQHVAIPVVASTGGLIVLVIFLTLFLLRRKKRQPSEKPSLNGNTASLNPSYSRENILSKVCLPPNYHLSLTETQVPPKHRDSLILEENDLYNAKDLSPGPDNTGTYQEITMGETDEVPPGTAMVENNVYETRNEEGTQASRIPDDGQYLELLPDIEARQERMVSDTNVMVENAIYSSTDETSGVQDSAVNLVEDNPLNGRKNVASTVIHPAIETAGTLSVITDHEQPPKHSDSVIAVDNDLYSPTTLPSELGDAGTYQEIAETDDILQREKMVKDNVYETIRESVSPVPRMPADPLSLERLPNNKAKPGRVVSNTTVLVDNDIYRSADDTVDVQDPAVTLVDNDIYESTDDSMDESEEPMRTQSTQPPTPHLNLSPDQQAAGGEYILASPVMLSSNQGNGEGGQDTKTDLYAKVNKPTLEQKPGD